MNSVSKRQFWTAFGFIFSSLWIAIGLIAAGPDSTTQTVYPAASAPHVANVAPAASPLYKGNPFTAPQTEQNGGGEDIAVYSCAPGLTPVDLPIGKTTPSGQSTFTVSEIAGPSDSATQTSVKMVITLDKTASLPGLILHTAYNANYNGGRTSDTGFVTRLVAGTHTTYTFDTSTYTSWANLQQISYITACVQS